MGLTIVWTIGIFIAIAGVGLLMYYQGKGLEATGSPDQQKDLGKVMVTVGVIWLAMALLFCAAVVILRITTPVVSLR
ncbi:MAG: hypothetical protein WB588_07675 [Dehalococcoidia bacterium]|jgi:hypothetical protein